MSKMPQYIFVLALLLYSIPIQVKSEELTKKDFLNLAFEYSGFETLDTANKTNDQIDSLVILKTTHDIKVPFLLDSNTNISIYEIIADSIDIRRNKNFYSKDADIIRSFSIFIDASSGRLLIIKSIVEDSVKARQLEKLKLPIKTEKRLLNETGNQYLDFPKEKPKTSFLNALIAARHCNPIYCNSIEGLFINYKLPSGRKRIVWKIFCWEGLPEPILSGMSQNLPENWRNSYSCIVDDSLGVCRSMSTELTRRTYRLEEK